MSEIRAIEERTHMIRFLDGYSAERKTELDERKTKQPLVKSYLLEQTSHSHKGDNHGLAEILDRRGILLEPIEEGTLWRIYDRHRQDYFGFMEAYSDRYSAIYTIKEVPESDRWVRNLVMDTSELDHLWISGWTFNQLWRKVIELNHPSRFVRIQFLHNSVFEIDEEDLDQEESNGADEVDEGEEIDFQAVYERRAAKFSLVDRISVVKEKLARLQKIYSPLYAISQLRFPSPTGTGGHDFYYNGKVTNRSNNFRDHRGHLLYVQRIYDRLTTATEKKAWFSIESVMHIPGEFHQLMGAPITIRFSEPLNEATFEHWITSTFSRGRNRFRLWGNPIRLGSRKVHVYGLDRHLWQPIFLEITDRQLLAIIPRGTCGNTVHRLVTNIQRFIDPSAKAYIGDMSYDDIIRQSSVGVRYDIER